MAPRGQHAAAFALLVGLGLAPEARAHRFEHPKSVRLGVRSAQLVVSVVFDVNPGPESRQARTLFDRDSDGVLDQQERARLTEWMVRTAMVFFELRVGGPASALTELPEPRVEAHRVDAPVESTRNLGVSLLYEVPLPPGRRIWVEIRDRDKDASKHVPVTVDVSSQLFLLHASQGEWDPSLREVRAVALRRERPLVLTLERTVTRAPALEKPEKPGP